MFMGERARRDRLEVSCRIRIAAKGGFSQDWIGLDWVGSVGLVLRQDGRGRDQRQIPADHSIGGEMGYLTKANIYSVLRSVRNCYRDGVRRRLTAAAAAAVVVVVVGRV